MVLNRDELVEVLSEDTVNASTYTIANRTYIRLFNTNEQHAYIPALYPNTKEYREKLKTYNNTTGRRVDQIGGIRAANSKVDLEIVDKDLEYTHDLPPLPKSCQELFDKLNDGTLDDHERAAADRADKLDGGDE